MDAKYMKLAAEMAVKAVSSGKGGPFGAVIVKDGEVIAAEHNMVIANIDPTAHAEITAIRAAAARLGSFDLSACEIYSSCEPCPMCLAALHWARIPRLYYGCAAEDAEKVGFDDKYLYDMFAGKPVEKRLESVQTERECCLEAFELWAEKKNKTRY